MKISIYVIKYQSEKIKYIKDFNFCYSYQFYIDHQGIILPIKSSNNALEKYNFTGYGSYIIRPTRESLPVPVYLSL